MITGGRRQGITYYNMERMSLWLSYHRNGKALYASLNKEWPYNRFCEWFPHLVLTKLREGIKV